MKEIAVKICTVNLETAIKIGWCMMKSQFLLMHKFIENLIKKINEYLVILMNLFLFI